MGHSRSWPDEAGRQASRQAGLRWLWLPALQQDPGRQGSARSWPDSGAGRRASAGLGSLGSLQEGPPPPSGPLRIRPLLGKPRGRLLVLQEEPLVRGAPF